jgi:hypothetical protein
MLRQWRSNMHNRIFDLENRDTDYVSIFSLNGKNETKYEKYPPPGFNPDDLEDRGYDNYIDDYIASTLRICKQSYGFKINVGYYKKNKTYYIKNDFDNYKNDGNFIVMISQIIKSLYEKLAESIFKNS